jgi:hypothetical protein
MLDWAKENLYSNIGEEWDYKGKEFDPLVHLLVGSCASEIKNIFDAMDGSDRRIVKKLTELLVPEQAHRASPAHALASVVPTASSAKLVETMQFKCQAEAGTFYFSPVFPCTILNSTLKVVGSDGLIFQYKGESQAREGNFTHVSKILLGFESPKPITSFHHVLFYFNLMGNNNHALFLQAISQADWKINGQKMEINRGFKGDLEKEDQSEDLENYFTSHLEEVYSPYFFTTKEQPTQGLLRRSISDVVISWMRENNTITPKLEMQAQALPLVDDNFFWVEIQLPHAVRVLDFESSFQCSTSVFPVANRQFQVKDDADTFLNQPSLDVVAITPEKSFSGVYKVENIQNKQEIKCSPFTKINSNKVPSYFLRYGGVGRLDNYTTWSRFSYMLRLFREEHRYKEVVEKLGKSISLEELHLILDGKIQEEEMAEVADTDTLYVFLQPGFPFKESMRVRISYWVTDGAKANLLPAGKTLVCDPVDPVLHKDNFYLLTKPRGGKDCPNETEYFSLLRSSVQKSDSIVTKSDIFSFCKRYLGKELKHMTVETGVFLDPNPGKSLSRALQIDLEVENPTDPHWEDTCRDIENQLNARSTGILPYIVKIKRYENA